MKRLIIISFILISTNAFAFGKCEDRLQEIEEDLSRVRHHLGLYKTTQYLGLYKTTQLFETDRLKILEDKVVYLEKYLNIYIPDPNYAFSYYSKVPKGKLLLWYNY